jgi:hypothetical protein
MMIPRYANYASVPRAEGAKARERLRRGARYGRG